MYRVLKGGKGNEYREKGRREIAVKKAWVEEHQRNHQCETLPCP